LARHYLPAAVVILRTEAASSEATAKRVPWLAAMNRVNGRAAAYVCQNFTCRTPVTDPNGLEAALKDAAAPRRIIG
jgi:uncharacterized protein YyaL (SSP411 family)